MAANMAASACILIYLRNYQWFRNVYSFYDTISWVQESKKVLNFIYNIVWLSGDFDLDVIRWPSINTK